MIRVLDQIPSNAIALAVGLPADANEAGIPTYGKYAVYQNARYRIDVRNGRYYVSDISVYDSDGDLITDSTDAYLSAINDAIWESAAAIAEGVVDVGTDIGGGLKQTSWLLSNIGLIALAAGGFWLYQMSKR